MLARYAMCYHIVQCSSNPAAYNLGSEPVHFEGGKLSHDMQFSVRLLPAWQAKQMLLGSEGEKSTTFAPCSYLNA